MNTNQRFKQAGELFQKLAEDSVFCLVMQEAAVLISEAFINGSKLLIFGNGGSAAQAQHFSAELVGRFKKDRRALPAIALTTDTSILTAQANDAGFETVFSRQLEAYCKQNDIVVAITTSDTCGSHSVNIYEGLLTAAQFGARTIGLFSKKTEKLLQLTTVPIIVPHTDTSLIQLVHQHIIHELCELVEERL